MKTDFLLTILLWVSGVYVIVVAGLILYAIKTIADVRSQLRQLKRPRYRERDSNGRPVKERV